MDKTKKRIVWIDLLRVIAMIMVITVHVSNVYSRSFGIISNNISKVWNSGKITQQEINVVKWLCLRNNEVIDYAKTLYKSKCPKDIDVIIKTPKTNTIIFSSIFIVSNIFFHLIMPS